MRLIFRGFWGADELQAYRQALAARAAAKRPPAKRVLLDLKHCSVQSQEILDGMAAIIGSYAGQIESYAMLLPQSALLRLQMKRLMKDSDAVIFDDEQYATNWLDQR